MELKLRTKLTEVGVIPEDWSATTVRELIAQGIIEKPLDGNHGNIHPKSGDFVDYGIPFVMANNIQNGHVDLVNCSFIRKKLADSLQKGFSKSGDVLLTHKATIGNTAIVGEIPFPYIMLTPQVTYYRVTDRAKISNIYLRYYFDSPGFQSVIRALSGGGTRSYIGISAQHQLPIVLPESLPEQHAIAIALSDVDALLDNLDRLIAKKRDLKQSAIEQLLTGETRLPGFVGKWEVKNLGELATFHKGKGLPKSALTLNGKEACIHYGELFTQYKETIHETISRTDKIFDEFRSIANDVLMPTSDVTPRGLAKASCVLINDVILGGDILVIRADPSLVSGEFLSYVIRREDNQVLRLVTGTTVFHLYGADMGKFIFKLPNLTEQKAIVTVLSDIDAELTALEKRRNKTKDIKQAMMQELLTGKTRLVRVGDPHA